MSSIKTPSHPCLEQGKELATGTGVEATWLCRHKKSSQAKATHQEGMGRTGSQRHCLFLVQFLVWFPLVQVNHWLEVKVTVG